MITRRDASRGGTGKARQRLQTVTFHRRFRGDQQRPCAIVDTRRVARRDRTAVAEWRPQAGELVKLGIAARMFVGIDHQRIGLAPRHLDRHQFLIDPARRHGLGRALLAAPGIGVLIFTADLALFGQVLRRLRHGIDSVLAFHGRIDETPPDGRVVDLGLAGKRLVGLGHNKGRTRHAFDTAGDNQIRFARPYQIARPGRRPPDPNRTAD